MFITGTNNLIKRSAILGLVSLLILPSFIVPIISHAQTTSEEERAALEIAIARAQKEIEYLKYRQTKIDELIKYYTEHSTILGDINADDPVFKGLVQESGVSDDGIGTSDQSGVREYFSIWSTFFNKSKQVKIEGWEQDKKNLDLDIIRKEGQIYVWQTQLNGGTPEEIAQAEQEAKDNYRAAAEGRIADLRDFGYKLQNYDQKLAGCSINPISFNITGCIGEGLAATTGLLLWMTSYVTRLANNIFNLSIWISIEEFYKYASLPAVGAAWSIVRDICNLFFIFVLLYIAIGAILHSFISFDTKKFLPILIIVALLVNFSAVIPKVVIDVSNVFALQFYHAMGSGNNTLTGAPDLTTNMVSGFGFGKFTDPLEDSSAGNISGSYVSIIMSNLGQIALMLITALVLIVGGFMFFFRTIILLFLIIISPFYFLGMAVPYLSKHTGSWLTTLISQSLFAPIMMFLMLVVLTLTTGGEYSLKAQLTSSVGASSALNTLFYFVLANGMMIGALMVSSQVASSGGAMANKFRSAGTALLAGSALAAGGIAGRNVFGRVSNYAAQSNWLKNKATEAGAAGFAARAALGASRKVAGSSFDLRNIKAVQSVAQKSGLDLGKIGKDAGKGGYKEKLNKQIKAEEAFTSDFTDEQKLKYAESLEKRQRFGVPSVPGLRWIGAPTKRKQAAEKIGDLKARRKNEGERTAVETRNTDRDRQINVIKSSPVYQQTKAVIDQETGNLQAAERALASALEQGQAPNIINGYRRDIEAAKIKIKQAKNDFDELDNDIKRIEKEKEKPPEYKRKKTASEHLDELLEEKDKNKPKEETPTTPPPTGGSSTP